MSNVRHEYRSLAIATLLDRIGRLIQAECFTKELPPVQWSALRHLARNSATRQTIGSLAAFSGVSHSSASRTVAVLVRKGMVKVDAERGADRSRAIALTKAGWDLLEKDPLHRTITVIDALPQESKTALFETLNLVVNRLSQE